MSSGQKVKAFVFPGGRIVRLETDLEFGEIARICGETNANWLFLLATPEMGTGVALFELYKLACKRVGVDSKGATARVILDALQDVEDDLPEFYEDGHPKADDPTTD